MIKSTSNSRKKKKKTLGENIANISHRADKAFKDFGDPTTPWGARTEGIYKLMAASGATASGYAAWKLHRKGAAAKTSASSPSSTIPLTRPTGAVKRSLSRLFVPVRRVASKLKFK